MHLFLSNRKKELSYHFNIIYKFLACINHQNEKYTFHLFNNNYIASYHMINVNNQDLREEMLIHKMVLLHYVQTTQLFN